MAQTLTLALGFLSAVQALPSRWEQAEVKRGVSDVAKEYDYIVGKSFHRLLLASSTDKMQLVVEQLVPQSLTVSPKTASVRSL
jgi:uncharacterized protein YutD